MRKPSHEGERRTRRSLLIALGLALFAFALPVPAPAAAPVTVTISRYAFDPPVLSVQLGQPIVWRNAETGPVPLDTRHNLIENLYVPAGQPGPPVTDTKEICPAFSAGSSCSPPASRIVSLLPRGRHFLTCTIDRDHVALMHFVVDVT